MSKRNLLYKYICSLFHCKEQQLRLQLFKINSALLTRSGELQAVYLTNIYQ